MSTGTRQAIRASARAIPLDERLLLPALGLISLGVVMVASSSIAVAEAQGLASTHYLWRHVFALAIGTALAWALYRLGVERLYEHSQALILLAILLLLLVWLPGFGVRINGAQRWVRLGVLNFQMVEAVKLLLIVYLAGYCVRQAAALRQRLVGILKPLLLTGVLASLLIVQPDFGGAALIVAIALTMVWLAGASLTRLAAIALIALPVLLWVAVAESYRLQRLLSFVDPWKDPYADGFQLTQALIAVGRGEWFGVGLGESVQKLFYLPEAHTDFIVAVLAEELGFFGLLAVLTMFVLLCGRSYALGQQALDRRLPFHGYLAYGIATWFAVQAVVSIGVNLGVLPTKGLTLPFVSSGGSSAMLSVAGLGLLLRISADLRGRELAAGTLAAPAAEASAALGTLRGPA